MSTLLILIAGALLVCYFAFVFAAQSDPEPRPDGLVRTPSQSLGRLRGKAWFEQWWTVGTAKREAELAVAEAGAAQAFHERNIVDKADETGVPRDVYSENVLKQQDHERAKDTIDHTAKVEVQKEAAMLQVWLTAARTMQLTPYLTLQQIQEYLESAYKRRYELRQLRGRTDADDDMLTLLNKAIPVLERDFHARVGQIALSANNGEEHRGSGSDSDGPGGFSEAPETDGEPPDPPKHRAGY